MKQSNVKTMTVMTTHPTRLNRPRCIQKVPATATTKQSKRNEEFTPKKNATPATRPTAGITIKMVDQQFNAQDLEAFLKKVKSKVFTNFLVVKMC